MRGIGHPAGAGADRLIVLGDVSGRGGSQDEAVERPDEAGGPVVLEPERRHAALADAIAEGRCILHDTGADVLVPFDPDPGRRARGPARAGSGTAPS